MASRGDGEARSSVSQVCLRAGWVETASFAEQCVCTARGRAGSWVSRCVVRIKGCAPPRQADLQVARVFPVLAGHDRLTHMNHTTSFHLSTPRA